MWVQIELLIANCTLLPSPHLRALGQEGTLPRPNTNMACAMLKKSVESSWRKTFSRLLALLQVQYCRWAESRCEKVPLAGSSSPCPEPVRTRPMTGSDNESSAWRKQRAASPPGSGIWSLYPMCFGVSLAPENPCNTNISRHQLACTSQRDAEKCCHRESSSIVQALTAHPVVVVGLSPAQHTFREPSQPHSQ